MIDRLPPLPEDDDALEALMSKHLEPMAPSADVRERTLASLREQATPAPSDMASPTLVGAVAVCIAAVFVLILAFLYLNSLHQPGLPGVAPGAPPAASLDGEPDVPPLAPDQEPAPVPAPDEDPAPDEEPAPDEDPLPGVGPVGDDDGGPTWRFKPGQAADFEADQDYGKLKFLLKAETIVIGEVAEVDAEGAGILKRVELVRGKVPAKAPTVGEFNGCEGVPSFEQHVGKQVAVFLTERGGELQILHGGSGIQRLPFRGKLDAAALKALIKDGSLAPAQLVGLIQAHGVSVLSWLEGHLSGAAKQAAAEEVQVLLRERLLGLTPASARGEVMGVVRYVQVPKLTAETLATLWTYHETFTANRLGAWVQGKPGYNNRMEDHHAFLRFMARVDHAKTVAEAERMGDVMRQGADGRDYPAVWVTAYEKLVEELRKTGERQR